MALGNKQVMLQEAAQYVSFNNAPVHITHTMTVYTIHQRHRWWYWWIRLTSSMPVV